MRSTLFLAALMMLPYQYALGAPKKPAESAQDEDARRADDAPWEESDKLPVVQNRKYRVEHELELGAEHHPIDPYTKAVALGGGYTWHLTDIWGISARFNYLFNYKAALREKLEGNFAQPNSKFRRLNYYAQLGVDFKPLYGKLAFLNNKQVYGDFYFTARGVFAQMTGGETTETERSGRGDRYGVGVAPGFGLRAYINRYMSVRFDLSWMILVTGSFLSTGDSPLEVVAPLTLGVHLSFTTRSDS